METAMAASSLCMNSLFLSKLDDATPVLPLPSGRRACELLRTDVEHHGRCTRPRDGPGRRVHRQSRPSTWQLEQSVPGASV